MAPPVLLGVLGGMATPAVDVAGVEEYVRPAGAAGGGGLELLPPQAASRAAIDAMASCLKSASTGETRPFQALWPAGQGRWQRAAGHGVHRRTKWPLAR